MKTIKADALPIIKCAEEMDFLRKRFKETLENYSLKMEGDILHLKQALVEASAAKKISASKLRDCRDMMTLVRQVDIKPEKGRRRDLKKLDLLVEELQRFVENW